MTTGNTMQVDALVALQEAEVREGFLKQRTLLLGQHLTMQKQENQILIEKINSLEAEVARLSWNIESPREDGASE